MSGLAADPVCIWCGRPCPGEASFLFLGSRSGEFVLGRPEGGWADYPPVEAQTKRDLIQGYTSDWKVAQLAGLARRVVTELDVHDSYLVDLRELLATFDAGGGVEGPTKNLIFAANGPKPEIRLRDAMNNDIEIVKHAEFCLVFDQPVPA